MAVREAAINAVLHGNEYDPARQIDVSRWKIPARTW
jgi:anti-sigma regulatory factor (Ser/Thr protein kinase)